MVAYVGDFTNSMWYVSPMVIIERSKFNCEDDIETVKSKSLMVGTPHDLRSIVYDDLRSRKIDRFGVRDNMLIIEVV